MTKAITKKIEGHDVAIVGDVQYQDNHGFINLTVTVKASGESFDVGGASFTCGGTPDLYQIGEAGEIEELTAELGYDPNEDTLCSVLDGLHAAAAELIEAAAADIDACAPKCTHGNHRWETDPNDGCKENPGVRAVGGAAILTREYCLCCGCERERIAGDVNQAGNRNGVTYIPRAMTGDELSDLRTAYGYADS